MKNYDQIKALLENRWQHYHHIDFIAEDPIAIPHQFSQQQDIEIAAFFAAILAWGKRSIILNNANKLMNLMGNSPYDFILNHQEKDLKPFLNFVHRTFNDTDLLYFISYLKHHYQTNISLEAAFIPKQGYENIYTSLTYFHQNFFSLDFAPERTKKHIASPLKNSACKRLNMFLRWMVRKNSEVDFGIWNAIPVKDLICPIDVHVGNVARSLGLLERKQNDWNAAMELTENLRTFDQNDPVKYDYALFSMGVNEKNKNN
ncbi:MAG TPA: TIGR02757 family protein [Edaphocola sp.]|nr:TIGR02757 family protein [Edaphocola sp.]